jgi:hypothetical protein
MLAMTPFPSPSLPLHLADGIDSPRDGPVTEHWSGLLPWLESPSPEASERRCSDRDWPNR